MDKDITPVPIDDEGRAERLRAHARMADLDVRFAYHPPKPDQPGRWQLICDMAKGFAKLLITACPESRELSLALTALEEAVFWANASIARREL